MPNEIIVSGLLHENLEEEDSNKRKVRKKF